MNQGHGTGAQRTARVPANVICQRGMLQTRKEATMRYSRATILSLGIATILATATPARVARAQSSKATINDPVGPQPDPTHITIVLPSDIKWTGQEGRQPQ